MAEKVFIKKSTLTPKKLYYYAWNDSILFIACRNEYYLKNMQVYKKWWFNKQKLTKNVIKLCVYLTCLENSEHLKYAGWQTIEKENNQRILTKTSQSLTRFFLFCQLCFVFSNKTAAPPLFSLFLSLSFGQKERKKLNR